jgi:hypothetical protein
MLLAIAVSLFPHHPEKPITELNVGGVAIFDFTSRGHFQMVLTEFSEYGENFPFPCPKT